MSFASETKEYLAALPLRRKCCRNALLYGLFYAESDFWGGRARFSTDSEKISSLFVYLMRSVLSLNIRMEDTQTLSRNSRTVYRLPIADAVMQRTVCDHFSYSTLIPEELFVCDECQRAFFRGVFLACGRVNDPNRGYHMEFCPDTKEKCSAFCGMLNGLGRPARLTNRAGEISVYMKESESIEDFLTAIGAPNASMSVMTAKILKEIRNNENRRNNCDTANLYKSTGVSVSQIRIINALREENLFYRLPEQLRETAELRLANPEASYGELAEMHEPPITKSGVSHRLQKVCDYYKKNAAGGKAGKPGPED